MPGIVVKNLTKKFKSFKAVSDINFDVERGSIVGFLGPNGAGKTTTLRMLVGLSKPSKGSIEIAGEKMIFSGSNANYKFGYLPEQPSFYGWMSGYEYLSFIADTFKISGEEKDKAIKKVLENVDLEQARDKKISSYSNGMKQRLGIAQALINEPEVLIMDEPVSALDPIGRKEVLKVISALKGEKTILFSTHILSDVDKICDAVIIINKGKIVASSSLSELKEKHAKPILEIEFSSDCTSIVRDIKSFDWVSRAENNGNHLKIWLKDINVMEQNTPVKEILVFGQTILKYGLALPEVEDLFVGLVENNK